MKMRTGNGAVAAAGRPKGRSSLALTLISALLVAGASLLPVSVGGAQAADARLVQMGKRAASVNVVIGKSEDIRTDQSFMEVVVGDPEIADVNPLTDRTVSILGKKIGTTRVVVYAEGKKQVGIFDVEVSYDVVKLSVGAFAAIPAGAHQGVAGERPHHALRHRARRRHRRQGGDDRQAIRARRNQLDRRHAAAAGSVGGPLRRGFARGEPRTRRQLEHHRQDGDREPRHAGPSV